jgi:folylpolyglutamate synthase/dihydropteroate synthase
VVNFSLINEEISRSWSELSGTDAKDCELFSNVADGIERIKTIASQLPPNAKVNVLVTGSLYLVGAVLQVCNIEV